MTKRQQPPPSPESHLPVPPATFEILMALVGAERHGYAIMQEVGSRTRGVVRLGAGTLYGSLKRMLETGLVEEAGVPVMDERDDERRRYYRLTDFGMAVARAEARRLEAMLRVARRKNLLRPEPA